MSSRAAQTLVVAGLAAVTTLFLNWLSQVTLGAIIGADVGAERVLSLSAQGIDALNTAWWASPILALIVCMVAGARTHTNLSGRYAPGVNWGDSFWRPVLIAVLVYAIIFGSVFSMWV